MLYVDELLFMSDWDAHVLRLLWGKHAI